ncbi:MAG: hypothetical protein KBT48_08565 [Firmicutes bacterium]|nr:hypothetical protein [Bacillota bacterium]
MLKILMFQKDPKKNYQEAMKNIILLPLFLFGYMFILWKIGLLNITPKIIYLCLGATLVGLLLDFFPAKNMLNEKNADVLEKAYKVGIRVNAVSCVFLVILSFLLIGWESIVSSVLIIFFTYYRYKENQQGK